MTINKKLAFIGCGKMAQAIIHGLLNSQAISPQNLILTARSQATRDKLTAQFPDTIITGDNHQACQDADLIVLGVKPQMMPDLCQDLDSSIQAKTVISIAAGLKIKTFLSWLSTKSVIRLMPNTPLTVGLGASAYCLSPETPKNDKDTCEAIFAASGIIEEVQESQMDAVTALSGSGPAYIFELIDSMVESSVKNGLSHETSTRLACQTLIGAAEMVKTGIDTAINLKKAVTSPNGTTEAALNQMDEDNFRTIVDRFLNKAVERSIELGK